MNVGDLVRVRNPDDFLQPIRSKVRDRTGVVDYILPWKRPHVIVKFGKRNGRGKEFSERFAVSDLELAR